MTKLCDVSIIVLIVIVREDIISKVKFEKTNAMQLPCTFCNFS